MATDRIAYRPATEADARDLAPRLRVADLAELELAGCEDAEAGLLAGVRQSAICWAADVNGRVEALFGVTECRLLDGVVGLWMLGSGALERLPTIRVVRESVRWLARLSAVHPVMVARVDARYDATLRWLRLLGWRWDESHGNGEIFAVYSRAEA